MIIIPSRCPVNLKDVEVLLERNSVNLDARFEVFMAVKFTSRVFSGL